MKNTLTINRRTVAKLLIAGWPCAASATYVGLPETDLTGTVCELNSAPDFGRIWSEGQLWLFVRSEVLRADEFARLRVGSPVVFKVGAEQRVSALRLLP